LLEMGGLRILSHGGLRLVESRVQAPGRKVRRDLIGKRIFGFLPAQWLGRPRAKQAKI